MIKRLTETGRKDLINYTNNLVKMIATQKAMPFRSTIMGFPPLEVHSRDELFGRIQMLKEIVEADNEPVKTKVTNNSKVKE